MDINRKAKEYRCHQKNRIPVQHVFNQTTGIVMHAENTSSLVDLYVLIWDYIYNEYIIYI